MSRYSDKKRLRRDFWYHFLTFAIFENLIVKRILEWLIIREIIKKQRYLTFRINVFKFNWIMKVLSRYFDFRFRKFVRMNRDIFKQMLHIIEDDLVFYNEFNVFQVSIWQQFLIALHKLNHDDIDVDYSNVVNTWEKFENFIYKCTQRMMLVLFKKKNQYIVWSDEKQRKRENMINDVRANFIDCVEKLNESDIVFIKKSDDKYDNEIFFNKKKRYVMNLLNVCDFKKMFTYMLNDWSNSQHDVRVFVDFVINKKFEKFFDKKEYLLIDNVYVNVKHVISFYKTSTTFKKINRRFNRKLFNIRIDIEHAFDMFKNRWINLIEFRLCLYNENQYEYVVKWIIVCVVLHNVLLTLKNSWSKTDDWWIEKNENEHNDDMTSLKLKQIKLNLDRREFLKTIVLETKNMW